MAKIKLLFVCARFGGGGAEMHLLRVLSYADLSKFEIHLALTRDGGNYESRLPVGIKIHHLTTGIDSSTKALLKSYFPLKKLVVGLAPKAIISFMDPQNLLLAYVKKNIGNCPAIIFACQNAPVKSLLNDGLIGKLFLVFLKKWYRKYPDKIIAICAGVQSELEHILQIKKPVKVIYNAGFDKGYEALKNENLPEGITKAEIQIVACGRLTKQKGFDILIEAVKLINTESKLNVWILGVGEDLDKLSNLRDRLGLQEKISFFGFQSNPYKYFKNADIFVLSSRWEGFGNVITEAMVCGCAVVAANCDYGPNEIITDKVDGLLCSVEDAEEIARNIQYLIENKDKAARLIEKGLIRAKAFTSEEISRQYFDEILNTINQ